MCTYFNAGHDMGSCHDATNNAVEAGGRGLQRDEQCHDQASRAARANRVVVMQGCWYARHDHKSSMGSELLALCPRCVKIYGTPSCVYEGTSSLLCRGGTVTGFSVTKILVNQTQISARNVGFGYG